jgi:D-3-phosphoglycerate dehydrogenase
MINQVDQVTRAYSEEELLAKLPAYHAVGIRSKTKMTAKVIDACPNVSAGSSMVGEWKADRAISSSSSDASVSEPTKSTSYVQPNVVCPCSTRPSPTRDRSPSWSLERSSRCRDS